MTFAEKIRQQCQTGGSETALALGGGGPDAISYAKLGFLIDNMCARLARLNVRPGGVYGIVHRDTLLHVVSILALERLGAVTVTLKDLDQAKALGLAGAFVETVSPRDYPVHRVDAAWLYDSDGARSPTDFPEPSPDDICRIAYTSGSTGEPKAVALTHRMLALRIADQNLAFGEEFGRMTRRFSAIGFDVLFGYRLLIRTLAEGGLFCFRDPDTGRHARGLAYYKIQCAIGSPQQLADLADFGERHPGSFPSLEMVVCGGARLPPLLAERLRRHVCARLMTGYGSSEGGIVAAGLAETLDLAKGEIGKVIPNVDIEIVSQSTGKPLKSGQGLVRIRGEGVARGYYGETGGADSPFSDGWFYPGDVGTLSAKRVLSIAGRKDNVVSFGGVKTTLESVETQLARAPGVGDLAAIAIAGENEVNSVAAFVVAGGGWSETAFWDDCRARLDKALWPAKLVMLAELPRLTNGKIDRRKLASLVPA